MEDRAVTLKRELIKKIKLMKEAAVPLSPSECDELILLLGGTTRSAKRPKKLARPFNFAAVGGVFFGYLQNYENVKEYQDDIRELNSDAYLTKSFARITAKNRTEAELSIKDNIINEIQWKTNLIDTFLPKSAKTQKQAHEMTAKYFTRLGHSMNEKQVSNLIKDLKEAAGIGKGQKFGLNEWYKIMATEDARCSSRIAIMQKSN